MEKKVPKDPHAPKPPLKKKKKKDPLAPKQPLSSYMEFVSSERPKIQSELGTLSLVEMGKELGRRWRCLSKEVKEVFEKKSKENREEYEKELEVFSRSKSDKPGPDSDPSPPTVSNSEAAVHSSSQPCVESNIKLEHLGFAKQDGYDWHPALKTSVMARGTRVKVTFFGTGQFGTVNRAKWVVFSDLAEKKIKTVKLAKSAPFLVALNQMKSLRNQVLEGMPVTSSGIGFDPQMGGRKLKSLDKDHLQAEEEDNSRKMEKKMFQLEGSTQWNCRDCDWNGKFRHKAKAHARDCGQRKRVNQKKSKDKKFECSNADCVQSFAKKSQLLQHYRYVNSPPCFPSVSSFKRST